MIKTFHFPAICFLLFAVQGCSEPIPASLEPVANPATPASQPTPPEPVIKAEAPATSEPVTQAEPPVAPAPTPKPVVTAPILKAFIPTGPIPSWSFQLEGAIVPKGKTYHIVDLNFCNDFDLGRLRVLGTKPIAYVSSQYEEWRPDEKQFPKTDTGKKIWDGEHWVNTESASVRSVMKKRIALAKQRNFHGIVFDNVDFTDKDTGFDSSPKTVSNYIKFLIRETTQAGLKFGLKGGEKYLTDLGAQADFFMVSDGISKAKLKHYAAISKPIFNYETKAPKPDAPEYLNSYSVQKNGSKLNDKETVISKNAVPLLTLTEDPSTITSWSIQYLKPIEFRGKDYHVVDLFDVSDQDLRRLKSEGSIPIAYFSSQYEDWRDDTNQFPKQDIGENLDDWDGERWINPKSKPIRAMMIKRMQLAKKRGFYGIDVDNVDFYHFETGFDNSKQASLEYIRFFIAEAKKLGLKFSLKNATDLAYQLRNEVDFYQNEEGIEYKELHKYIGVGKPVFNIEYKKPKPGVYFPGIYSIYKSNYKMDGREVIIHPIGESK